MTVAETNPGLLEELGLAKLKMTKLGTASVGGRSAETGIPFNPAASDLQRSAANTILVWYAEFVRINCHLTPLPTGSRLSEAAGWMGVFPNLLAQMPEAAKMADEFRWLAEEIRRTIDAPAVRIFLGVCSGQTEAGEECLNDLYVPQGQAFARCWVCGAEHDVQARRDTLLAALQYQNATLRDIAMGLPELLGRPLSLESLRSWSRNGELVVTGKNLKGHATYRVGQVINVALSKQTRNREKVAKAVVAA